MIESSILLLSRVLLWSYINMEVPVISYLTFYKDLDIILSVIMHLNAFSFVLGILISYLIRCASLCIWKSFSHTRCVWYWLSTLNCPKLLMFQACLTSVDFGSSGDNPGFATCPRRSLVVPGPDPSRCTAHPTDQITSINITMDTEWTWLNSFYKESILLFVYYSFYRWIHKHYHKDTAWTNMNVIMNLSSLLRVILCVWISYVCEYCACAVLIFLQIVAFLLCYRAVVVFWESPLRTTFMGFYCYW